jgi:hypothetical protein
MAAKAGTVMAELVADTDARSATNWAKFLAKRQPADGDYGWRDRKEEGKPKT